MAQEICGKTKVIYKGKEYLCDKFPQVWRLFNDFGYAITEGNKTNLIRLLFINGSWEIDDDLKLEISWED